MIDSLECKLKDELKCQLKNDFAFCAQINNRSAQKIYTIEISIGNIASCKFVLLIRFIKNAIEVYYNKNLRTLGKYNLIFHFSIKLKFFTTLVVRDEYPLFL